MRKRLQIFAIVAIILILASTLAVFLANTDFSSPKPQPIGKQYLFYNGNMSKIFLVAATTTYVDANQTYGAANGQLVQKGSPLFILTLTLRNDYTSDEPPPPFKGIPISPADGTAYVYLTAQLYDKGGVANASDVTVPDFSIPSTPGAALVLASGQTEFVDIYMAVDQKSVIGYDINMIYVGDSIPT